MKKIYALIACLFFSVGLLLAQTVQVTGVVTSSEDGAGLPGASVIVKGTSRGTITDVNGKFSITVPENGTLEFTSVGMKNQTISVAGKTVVNIVMNPDVVGLEEVVVTGLGIKRQEKTLGFSATSVGGDEITTAQSNNLMQGLAGKVAGVQVSNAGGPGSSTKVIIRGFSSLSQNQPLYVVDGVPVNNEFQGNDDFSRSVDFGNGAGDINPEDVESVNVLKGASATALYGSRASNGVIMITTKSGKKSQGKVQVVYSGSYGVSEILRVPQTQDMFGQGWGLFDPAENGSWGPKFDGVNRPWGTSIDPATGEWAPAGYDYDTGTGYDLTQGTPRFAPFSYVKDNARNNFYERGYETNQNFQVSGGSDISSYVFSYGYTQQDGVIPTDADLFKRHTMSFRGTSKFNRFETNYSVNYVRRDVSAVATGQGQSDGGATLFQEMIQTPGGINLGDLKDYNSPYNNSDNFYTWYASNPWYVVNENGNKLQDERVHGKFELSYELIDGLKAIGRLGGDFGNSRLSDWGSIEKFNSNSWSAAGAKQETVGRYEKDFNHNDQIDANLLLDADYTIGTDWSVKAVAGMNYNQISTDNQNSYVTGLKVPKWYSLENSGNAPIATSEFTRRRLIAALGQVDLGFKDFWFLTLSARNDWSSTLPAKDRSYFYGGAATSLIITDMLKSLKSDVLSFWKIRAAVGQTGNDAPIYRTSTSFQTTKINLGYGDMYLPLNGVSGLTYGNTLGNVNLKPEITTEIEFGTDIRFFNNRIGLDIAYYDKGTKNQIFTSDLAPETGFTYKTLNIGKIRNRGIEASLLLVPVKTRDFSWDFATNLTVNRSEIEELYGGATELPIENAYSVDFVAEVGQPLGVFKVPAIVYVEEGPQAGKMVVNASGRPVIDPNKKETVGSSEADFVLGFNNKFTYKGWSLSAAIDWRQGGKFYSYTSQLMNFVGNSTETMFNERQPFLVPNSVRETKDSEGKTVYVENNVPITYTGNYAYWYSNTNNAMYKHTVLDRTYAKLREVALSYTLPKKWTNEIGVGQVEMSIYGRNLLLWTPKSNNFVDPEATNYGNDIRSEFGEFAAGPTTRTYGASLRIQF